MKKFPCQENCGACCKHIGNVKELAEFDLGNGTCKHLTEDLKCAIYETRPFVCRTIDVFERKWYFISWEEYVSLSLKCCEFLRNKLKEKIK
jgi:Fe-S-cluster containining protein